TRRTRAICREAPRRPRRGSRIEDGRPALLGGDVTKHRIVASVVFFHARTVVRDQRSVDPVCERCLSKLLGEYDAAHSENQRAVRSFFRLVVDRAQGLISDEHVTVDGTVIEAWASQNSFQRKDGSDGEGHSFRKDDGKNDTHAS